MQVLLVPSVGSGRPTRALRQSTLIIGGLALLVLCVTMGTLLGVSVGMKVTAAATKEIAGLRMAKNALMPVPALSTHACEAPVPLTPAHRVVMKPVVESSVASASCATGIPTSAYYAVVDRFRQRHAEHVVELTHKLGTLSYRHEQQRQASKSLSDELDGYRREVGTRLGEIQAQIVRLNALGTRLISATDLPLDEFQFGDLPAIGGPVEPESGPVRDHRLGDIRDTLDQLKGDLLADEQQLEVLALLLRDKDLKERLYPTGWPSRGGWLSSNYGDRHDPFTGVVTRHKGIDIANRHDAPILAAAAGVVIHAGRRSGYGLLVEINHGNGYHTRYAHASEVVVKAGERVQRGQMIAKIGQTGRATGPHLHFEVLNQGQPVNPSSFLRKSG